MKDKETHNGSSELPLGILALVVRNSGTRDLGWGCVKKRGLNVPSSGWGMGVSFAALWL